MQGAAGSCPESNRPDKPSRRAGERVDAVRLRLLQCLENYTYAEIARDTGIDEAAIRGSLTADECSDELIKAVCDVYMIDAEWLICGGKDGQSITHVNQSMRIDQTSTLGDEDPQMNSGNDLI